MSARDRAFARLLLLTVLRRLGQLDDLIDRRLDKPLLGGAKAGRTARNILRLGAAQLVFLKTPPHAAVDTSVLLADTRNTRRFKDLVNAVLRRIADTGSLEVETQDAACLNTPDWLWRRWSSEYGENGTRAIAAAHMREPPLDISVKASPELWAKRLNASLLPTGSLRRPAGGDITSLPGFSDGEWWVQDAAAVLPARLLNNVRGKTVVDLCAAPGGKTAQLVAMGAEVVAIDKSARRLDRLRSNLRRLHLAATPLVADATSWRPATPCDAVLLDAPCTATGTMRRHPDVGRSKSEADIARMVELQNQLLTAAVDMLNPGGLLIYAVCSLEPEEGPDRIMALLSNGAPLVPVPVTAKEMPTLGKAIRSDGFLRTTPAQWPDRGGLDGFFVARLKKLAAQ
jgi:16S rRNA (cytosine967-C5)-methyltransferase